MLLKDRFQKREMGEKTTTKTIAKQTLQIPEIREHRVRKGSDAILRDVSGKKTVARRRDRRRVYEEQLVEEGETRKDIVWKDGDAVVIKTPDRIGSKQNKTTMGQFFLKQTMISTT